MIQVEYVNPDILKPALYNPRSITDDAMGRLVKLLDAHGIIDPLIARRSDNMLIGGHQRLKANSLRANPDSLVPVVYLDVSDEQAKALNVALNNTKAMGEYDYSVLADLLQELDNGEIDVEAATGFAEKDIAELMHGLDEAVHEGEDSTPEPPETPVSKTGDLWVMGEHRLLCGDCGAGDDIVVCGPDHGKCRMVVTDPPYGVAYTGKTKDALTITNDSMSEEELADSVLVWFDSCERACGEGAYWFATVPPGPLHLVFAQDWKRRGILRQIMVWVKDSMVLGHSEYHYRHEPILFGWIPGERSKNPDRTRTTVWEYARPKASKEHPTMKPVEFFSAAIKNHTSPGEAVYEPFSGSGTTIIACEQLKRKCYAIEIEPRYVDVAVKRWQNYTKQDATLEGDGRTFNEIESERLQV
jgi:DNA modification methylase